MRKLRRTRRGSTTVSNASSRMARMERIPAMAEKMCITRAEMVADLVRASVTSQPNGFSRRRRTPGRVEDFGDDNVRFQRRSRVGRRSAQYHRPQERQRIVIRRGNRLGRDLLLVSSLEPHPHIVMADRDHITGLTIDFHIFPIEWPVP